MLFSTRSLVLSTTAQPGTQQGTHIDSSMSSEIRHASTRGQKVPSRPDMSVVINNLVITHTHTHTVAYPLAPDSHTLVVLTRTYVTATGTEGR